MQKQVTIGWKVATLNFDIASLRYRAMLPQLALESHGVKNRTFATPSRSALAGLDILVIVKSFTVDDYWLAQEATRLNIPVIFDLCDNIFIERYKGSTKTVPADVFLLIAGLASAIVVTTEPLADVVRERTGAHVSVYVVPDGIENEMLLSSVQKRLKVARIQEYIHRIESKGRAIAGALYRTLTEPPEFRDRLRRCLNLGFWIHLAYPYLNPVRQKLKARLSKLRSVSHSAPAFSQAQSDDSVINNISRGTQPIKISEGGQPSSRKIVWFGSHGAKYADFGMLDLLLVRGPLEKLAAEMSLELIVISNHFEKYKKNIRPMAIPSRYVEWSREAVAEHLKGAHAVVIPNSLDAFSICKSANRSVLSLCHGVPVVATHTPALDPLHECITFDDFENGLRRYLTDGQYAQRHVRLGQQTVEKLYGQQAIGGQWNDLAHAVLAGYREKQSSRSPQIILAIQLPQDIELARPILKEAKVRSIQCAVWTSLEAMKRWPQISATISALGLDRRIFPEDLNGFSAEMFPVSAFALVTVTETTLNPHRFTHRLTKFANSVGLYTATMQHGYENVGLTYTDDVHDIGRVRFASRRIYTWGNFETLHPNIPKETRDKCLPVGCPKPISVTQADPAQWFTVEKPVIGVFENLHWKRYTDEYREFFLEGVQRLADAFPEVVFLIKPHNAGMWLTNRYEGEKPESDNLVIADPADLKWANVTAPQLLGHLAAVITTPSTVALDAARVELPTAIVAHKLNLENYDPLTLIRDNESWSRFVSQTLHLNAQHSLRQRSRQFAERVVLSGDAVSRILDDIISTKQTQDTKHAA
jgi:hypothetical protein